MTNCWCSWKASDYADSRHNPSPSQPLSVLSSRHNRGVGMLTIGLNRYAVAEADIPIKACQSASTLPRHI
jgi:hypothetical protein